MKRDMDLVRQLLTIVEDQPAGGYINGIPQVGDASAELVAEHVRIMNDAGLLYADVQGSMDGGYVVLIFGLTWAGHDYLETVRNESVWKKVKSKVLEVGGGMTLEITKQLATTYLKEMLRMD